ncbi:MAG TPA: DNA-binding protein, partial [Oceanithermus sp.]|nr:DNA-binding protein [Oceanithermus sp.]
MRRILALFLFFALALAADRLYVAPDDGVGYLRSLVQHTKRELDLALYLWTRGRLDLAEALAEARRRGVRVRVLLDERPGGEPQDPRVLQVLKEAGVEVRFSSPLRFAHYHIKAMRADGRLWISTGNWTRSSFSKNREYSLVTDREDWVAEFKKVFEADWEARALALDDAKLVWSPERVYSVFRPFWEGNAKRRVLELIASAQRDLLIEQNGLTDEDVFNALLDAMDRGVRVRVLGSASARESNYFGRMAKRLAEEGAEVRYLEGLKVHAKAMLVDGRRAFLGSQNFTPTALTANRELGAVLEGGPALERLRATMEADWARARPALRPPRGPVPW